MPNFATDDGRYYWTKPMGFPDDAVEVPHAPIHVREECQCAFCSYGRTDAQKAHLRARMGGIDLIETLATWLEAEREKDPMSNRCDYIASALDQVRIAANNIERAGK